GEALGDARCTQDLGQRFGLLVGEPEHLASLIGVLTGIHDDFELTGAPGHNTDAVPVPVLELETQADAGQQYLSDIHTVNTAGSPVGLATNSGGFVGSAPDFRRTPGI